ncbi:MAG: hypothetical protein EXR73_01950 [Myxococcales bacterium]|nr:hypothetical protein [Myxococcales bacterium]
MKHTARLLTLVLVACATEPVALPDADLTPDAFVCPANLLPETPTITTPSAGRIDVFPHNLVFEIARFADPDFGDIQGASEWELWTLAGDTPIDRVWHAELTGRATQTYLAAGTYEGAAVGVGLAQWRRYGVRARVRDDHDACSQWSAWSSELAFRTDDGSIYLFDPSAVREFHITIPPESQDPINAQASPPGCVPYHRDYHEGALSFEGESFAGVGIHIKGGCGSSRNLGGKASFKINLGWDDPAVPGCPDERRLHGQKHLTLNNGVQDRTSQHERLAYWLYHQLGVPTPRAVTANVFVNDEYWGVYTLVEAIDRRFLDRWFPTNDGMLYEGTYWCDLIPANLPPGEEDTYCLTREFSPDACSSPPEPGADPETYDLLRAFVYRIDELRSGEFYPEVETFFDMETFFSQWALEAVISHWDAYQFSIMNNYRVYHDPTMDRWTLIPTGVDQTFGGDQDPWGVGGVLARRCLDEPDCEAAFAARLQAVNDLFEASSLSARAAGQFSQLWPHIQNDPRREYGEREFLDAYQELLEYISNRPTRIREHLAYHGY